MRRNQLWDGWYFSGDAPREENGTIAVSSNRQGLAYWSYLNPLNDLPVEVSADLVFTGKSGIGLFCRDTQHGRYEFLIQPDGTWFIRRNRNSWYGTDSAYMTILAHGTSSAIQPGSNHIIATCQGEELVFSLNGQELGRAQDNYYAEGQVGIFFDVFAGGSFTNFTILAK